MARDVAIYPSGATSPNGYDATYTSMSLMEATEAANSGAHHIDCEIVASDGSWSGSPDTTAVVFDGWDCAYASSRYLNIHTSGTAKPSATAFWSTTAYILKVSSDNVTMTIDNDHDVGNAAFDVVFTDIQVQHITTAQNNLLVPDGQDIDRVEFNRCWFQQDAASENTYISEQFGTELLFVNCVLDGGTHGIKKSSTGENVYIVNTTVVNVTDDAIESDNITTIYPINCVLFYNADDFKDTFPSGYPLRCATDQGAGEGTTGVDLTPGTQATDLAVTFEGPTTGDYRLTGVTTTADIIGVGTNQSENSRVPSVDMLGNARPTGSSRPCIGAFEYVSAGTTQAIAGVLPAMSGVVTRKKSYKRSIGGSI